jgi:8-oxo-dGTP pyrophosphatase MutT (NUDIX family)
MPATVRKVFAYITSGRRLLVFSHAHHPEAGIQVPAGTMQPGEDPLTAALREAREETGLTDLDVVDVVGEVVFDARPYGKDELHHRTFVHLRCREETPDQWEHWETDPHGEPGGRYLFVLAWASLDAPLPDLSAGHAAFIPELVVALDRPARANRPSRASASRSGRRVAR